jgi:2-keto-4-pentenoate hydratase/2-oxohepta-3-ene-1,7-dioic acid hydratase in catechol pathway
MKLVQFRAGDYEAVGLLEGGSVIDLSRAIDIQVMVHGWFSPVPPLADVGTISGLLELGTFDVSWVREVREFVKAHGLESELRLSVKDVTLLAPIARPTRIIALGLNYAAHAAEGGRKPPKEPIFFLKASTAVVGPDEPVVCPQNVGRIDHEVELAVVIAREGRRIPRAKAHEYIAGYTIMNDVTARDMQRRDMAASNPWFLSKSFDTFAPMGPCLVLPDEIQEPVELDLSLRVNGVTKQKSNTRQLTFKIPDLIHRFSKHITLLPGDVISTGTPDGISPIKPGDVMEAEVRGIGVLRNPVVAGK